MVFFDPKDLEQDLQKVISKLEGDFRQLRTGRVKAETFESVQVDAYGVKNPLNTIAQVTIESALSVTIYPYDKGIADNIVQAISESSLGFHPINEGDRIRINIPPLTEETRKETVKEMQALLEDARVEARRVRHKYMDKVNKAEDVSEDDQRMARKEIQKEVDECNKNLQDLAERKEEEIMKI